MTPIVGPGPFPDTHEAQYSCVDCGEPVAASQAMQVDIGYGPIGPLCRRDHQHIIDRVQAHVREMRP